MPVLAFIFLECTVGKAKEVATKVAKLGGVRISHAVTLTALFSLSIILSLGWLYLTGVFIALCLIVYEHTLVKENDLSKLDLAFFNMNGYISVTVFLFTLLDKIL